MSRISFLLKYIRYTLYSKTKYDIHSPFVFTFIHEVLEDKRYFQSFKTIELIRKKLLQNNTMLHVEDFGAGSKTMHGNERKVCDIAKATLVTPRFGQFLFRMATFFKPQTILELGTSLGISTLYLASASQKAQVITLEGSEAIAGIARKNFNEAHMPNIEILVGEFSQTLPSALQKMRMADMVFIDGNHRKTPTLSYFHSCLSYAHEDTILIFDDIHWSKEMEAAWQEIIDNDAVTLSIDLFFKGIVFFKKDIKEKQHFIIKM